MYTSVGGGKLLDDINSVHVSCLACLNVKEGEMNFLELIVV